MRGHTIAGKDARRNHLFRRARSTSRGRMATPGGVINGGSMLEILAGAFVVIVMVLVVLDHRADRYNNFKSALF